jgi:predicted esterase
MSVEELEKAVSSLAPEDYDSFRGWFADFDMNQWDKQIEEDSKSGRLDSMINKALEDYNAGRATDLKA